MAKDDVPRWHGNGEVSSWRQELSLEALLLTRQINLDDLSWSASNGHMWTHPYLASELSLKDQLLGGQYLIEAIYGQNYLKTQLLRRKLKTKLGWLEDQGY